MIQKGDFYATYPFASLPLPIKSNIRATHSIKATNQEEAQKC